MVRRISGLVVAGIISVASSQVGLMSAPAQLDPETRANSQCLVPTPAVFIGNSFFVQIDIKPGNRHNRINPQSEGVVAVAICSEDPDGMGPLEPTFDAPDRVIVICGPQASRSCRNHPDPLPDPLPHGLVGQTSSPDFGISGFEDSLHSCNVVRDINGDGAKDLVCHFHTDLTGLSTAPAAPAMTLRGCCKTPEFQGVNEINCTEGCAPSFPPKDVE